MSDKKHITLAELNSDPFFLALERETDRAAVVLAAAYLDTALEVLIKEVAAHQPDNDLFSGNGPLNSFSAKINIALIFGLISPDVHCDLQILRRIRNDFAHNIHEMSCESPNVASRIRELRLLKRLVKGLGGITIGNTIQFCSMDDSGAISAGEPLTWRTWLIFDAAILLGAIHERSEDNHCLPTFEDWQRSYYSRIGVPGWTPPEPNIRRSGGAEPRGE